MFCATSETPYSKLLNQLINGQLVKCDGVEYLLTQCSDDIAFIEENLTPWFRVMAKAKYETDPNTNIVMLHIGVDIHLYANLDKYTHDEVVVTPESDGFILKPRPVGEAILGSV